MLLPKFDFHEPTTITEACQILDRFLGKAKPISGGTDLMVNMKKKIIAPEHLVSLARIDELKQSGPINGSYRIGACMTVSEIAESPSLHQSLSALVQGARNLGTPLIRNLATIGGNLGSARPAADLPPSLMVYGARVTLASSVGRRVIPIDQFFVGPGLTEIQPNEILSEIHMDIATQGCGASYLGLGIRKAQDCNLVNVASFLQLDKDAHTIQTARIVMGSVGPTFLRTAKAENILVGEKATEPLFKKAAEASCLDSRPIDDFRGSAAYKRAMVGVLTFRTLNMALNQARNNS
jgi:carbon-monoxide dehydrogenase medium subunit